MGKSERERIRRSLAGRAYLLVVFFAAGFLAVVLAEVFFAADDGLAALAEVFFAAGLVAFFADALAFFAVAITILFLREYGHLPTWEGGLPDSVT